MPLRCRSRPYPISCIQVAFHSIQFIVAGILIGLVFGRMKKMPYDEKLAQKVRRQFKRTRGIVEKKMFGGLAFMLHGKMCCGVLKDKLVVRIGPENYRKVLSWSHVRPMDFTGRPLAGFVYVDHLGYSTTAALRKWITQATKFILSLPPK
jgi:TfoX/Sxy family transcriptional regulator of competence genes